LFARRDEGIGGRCLSPDAPPKPMVEPAAEPGVLSPYEYEGGVHIDDVGREAGERNGARKVPTLATRGRSPCPLEEDGWEGEASPAAALLWKTREPPRLGGLSEFDDARREWPKSGDISGGVFEPLPGTPCDIKGGLGRPKFCCCWKSPKEGEAVESVL